MRFRCPHCQKLLETDEVGKFLCPICKKWSRVPAPKKTAAVAEEEEILDVIAVPQESSGSRREAITDRAADERRPRRRRDEDEDEDEDVELEIVRDGERDRPRRRKRRRRRSSGGDSILDSINLPLILLIIMAPMGLGMIVLFFFVNPIAGFAGILMVGGWIWFALIAAEDGLVTVLMVTFVPFYSLYYASQNWDRVGIPFLMMIVGNIGVAVGSSMAKKSVRGGRMEGPAPIVRMLASAPSTATKPAG